MNRWDCGQPGCTASCVGMGGAIGLTAIGWYFRPGVPPYLRCPVHRPDGQREQRYMECPLPIGEACSSCRAEEVAHEAQVKLGAEPWLHKYTNAALARRRGIGWEPPPG